MTENKRVLITGIGGMDGSHLADLLVGKGQEVHGFVRRSTSPHYPNIRHLLDDQSITLHEGDLCDSRSIDRVVSAVRPDEVYNLAAQSHVGTSFNQAEYTVNATALGAMRVFDATLRYAPRARVYQSSSSEQWGLQLALGNSADEHTPFDPVSPYGISKVAAHEFAHQYRELGLHVSCGLLCNHESERRGHNFVTRKITMAAARIKLGLQSKLELGNLGAVRDWGYAPEYVEGMWRMLQEDEPGDFVLATGEAHSVRDWLEIVWELSGIRQPIQDLVSIVDSERRPTDIEYLVGNPQKAERVLGWKARTRFARLARIMVDEDLKIAKTLMPRLEARHGTADDRA